MPINTLRIAALLGLTLALGACSKKEGGDKAPAPAEKAAAKTDKKADDKAKTDTKAAAKSTKGESGPIAKVNGIEVNRSEFNKKYDKMTRAFTKRGKDIPDGLAQRSKESILSLLIEIEANM